jgi:hypothetical protein
MELIGCSNTSVTISLSHVISRRAKASLPFYLYLFLVSNTLYMIRFTVHSPYALIFHNDIMHCNETRQACYVERNNEARSCNHCCNGKELSIAYSECVFVAFGISMQCACAIFSSVARPALQNFSTSHKRHG